MEATAQKINVEFSFSTLQLGGFEVLENSLWQLLVSQGGHKVTNV